MAEYFIVLEEKKHFYLSPGIYGEQFLFALIL